ncbi:MAG: SPOR domain-containing protein [Candidatus Omnitrophota bacterium]
MGFLGRKKNADGSSSTLSETEIRKKLYGEFLERSSNVVAGDRDPFRIPVPSSKEVPSEKEAALDLFAAQNDVLSGVSAAPRRLPVTKSTDSSFRPISFQNPEKKENASVPALPALESSARFRADHSHENRGASFLELAKGILERVGELLGSFMAPEQVVLRRFFYWGAALLVVFFLFWGVNALNSQREDAMRVRYKIPGGTASEKTPVAVASVKPPVAQSAAVAPVSTQTSTSRATSGRIVSATPANSTYVVQVVTYAAKQDAEQVLKTFRRAGLRAFVKEDTRPSGRLFYQVLLGGFKTEAEAKAYLVKFQSKDASRPFQNAYVRLSRS